MSYIVRHGSSDPGPAMVLGVFDTFDEALDLYTEETNKSPQHMNDDSYVLLELWEGQTCKRFASFYGPWWNGVKNKPEYVSMMEERHAR